MAITRGAAPSRVWYRWWVALALGIIVLHDAFDLTRGYGTAFSAEGGR